ncbi:porin [Fulvimarina sp. MAC3]|uniref:porin n=1 Tax=Fulvimarina sp. MAC3 TaxID=3148887 RepID=UPI0031FCB648
MNIKSLLLGSAAALVAVTGARAADVIVPMAEPTEYVRVCDVYGTGFHYIPGTETCLSINGYVRFKYAVAGPVEDSFGNNFVRNAEGDDYQAGSAVRVRLNFDAREETELGTLRAFARIQATNTFGAYSNDESYAMDMGYIQLGGLTMGYLDSLFTEGDGLLTDTDLPIGDIQTNRVSYTFAAGGLAATVALEDDGSGDFAPNVVGKLGYSGGFGSFNLYGVYEESVQFGQGGFEPFGIGLLNPVVSEDAFVLKANASFKDIIAADSELKFEGSYAFDPSTYSTLGLFNNVRSLGNDINPFVGAVATEWQVGAGYAQSFGKLGLAVSGVYGETFDDFTILTAPIRTVNAGNGDYYKLVGNVGYEITNNFDMLAEVSYSSIDFNGQNGFVDNDADQTAGFVQFVRSF